MEECVTDGLGVCMMLCCLTVQLKILLQASVPPVEGCEGAGSDDWSNGFPLGASRNVFNSEAGVVSNEPNGLPEIWKEEGPEDEPNGDGPPDTASNVGPVEEVVLVLAKFPKSTTLA